MTSFAGIMTALAAIATATATLLGLYAHHQAAQLQQIRVTVIQQQQQIKQLTKSTAKALATPTASSGPNTSTSPPGSGLPGGSRYLSALNPTVNNSLMSTGQQVIAAQQYTNSIFFGCVGPNGDQPDEAYDVSGSSTFTAVVGIPDDASGATNVIATVTFTNEAGQRVGQSVQVSLGHPARVKLNIASVTQLGLTCVGRDARTGQSESSFQVALGNARVF